MVIDGDPFSKLHGLRIFLSLFMYFFSEDLLIESLLGEVFVSFYLHMQALSTDFSFSSWKISMSVKESLILGIFWTGNIKEH